MAGVRRHHFIKVMVGEFARRLEIPQDFLIHIPEVASSTSDTSLPSSAKGTLQNSEGKSWPVELERLDRRVFLTTGWAKFVEDTSLRAYEFLLFRYDENMHFMVLPFGLNACEKVIQSSGSPEGKLPGDIFCCSKRGRDGDKLTEATYSLTPSHSQVVTLQRSAQGHEHISSQSFPDQHEVCGSKDGLDEHLSLKGAIEDDKTNTVAEVMRTLDVDKVTVELFCAMLIFYKWNVDAVAEDLYICRGKPQIQNVFLKNKLLFQFDIVKRKLQNFFLPDDYCSSPILESEKRSLEEPKLSNQPLQCDSTAVKCRLIDEHDLCNFSQNKRRKRGSFCSHETPRRSPRLARQNNSRDNAKDTSKERSEEQQPSPASTIDQAEGIAEQAWLCHDKMVNGSLFQDSEKVNPVHGDVGLCEEPQHSQGENEGNLDQVNNKETGEEQTERNAVDTSESFTRRGCIESLPASCEVPECSKINELCFTWMPDEHVNSLEKVLLDIQRDNFMKTISHVQGIIRNHPIDILTADVITAVVQKEILKWDYCLKDRDAQRIVNALLEHAKKIKDMHNFNSEMRKEEFSTKLQIQLKWQLKELETAYTSLELDYKKATIDDNIAFSILHEQKKKLQNLKGEITGQQQSLEMKKDEMQKLAHQIADYEIVFQKSLMERLRIKEVMKSYEQTLAEVNVRLTSAEVGSIDVEALVKAEMDNMTKEIEMSKESVLNITFKK
ncbi:B3 domain-containing protein Os03g0120900-like [Oryza brachyantha]|uniref:TF-B3 domain-containing protein n=1 Tax=Oryza brachyantha TaxID=4533 RepID=J3L3M6_ORYBR|nr:B3 domain-containing protein Os03g0120900-like [Oryza brachyantha]